MSQTKRRILFRPASVLLLGALAMLLAQSVAHAASETASAGLLTITGDTTTHEAIGDPGGTSFSNPDGSAAGKGLPTVVGGWPDTPNFAPDPSFGGNRGISGFNNLGAPLTVSLAQSAPVSFTFFGKGDSTFNNLFQVNGQTLFGPGTYSQGMTDTVNLGPGPINFSWSTPQGVTVSNGGSSTSGNPGFFAAVNPYQTPTNTVFVGLTDRISAGGTSDHDFQDLGVRITAVPEPASLLMGSTAAVMGLGCAWSRRKRASA